MVNFSQAIKWLRKGKEVCSGNDGTIYFNYEGELFFRDNESTQKQAIKKKRKANILSEGFWITKDWKIHKAPERCSKCGQELKK